MNDDVFESGRIVDEMIAEGRRIVDSAIAIHKPIEMISAFSGGNDSIVTSHFAGEHYGAMALHCDTTTGVKPTADHVVDVARRFGWHLRIERAQCQGMPKKFRDGSPFDPAIFPCGRWTDGGTTYEEYVLNWGFPGPSRHNQMYQRLKERPIRAVQREIKRGRPRSSSILIISGIRGDESAVRAGYKETTYKVGSQIWVNPFYWRTARDFEAYRQEFGLPRNPCKEVVGISGECNCGAFAHNDKTAELKKIRIVDAGRTDWIDDLAARTRATNGYPWGWGQEAPSWYRDLKSGQAFLFPMEDDQDKLRPMCVGCVRGNK
jgi:3'-phosphoadenosine 5'-phosphosulfate sulfotransferase (PAPS reductase)/FAD synthetase